MTTKSSASVLARFNGRGGNARLVNALQEQFIIGGDLSIAKKIARKIHLQEFRTDSTLLLQGDPEDYLLFILGGSVEILVNGRQVAIRSAGEHVGEMSLLDTTARRSATVRALEATVVAQIAEEDFTRIATGNPLLWRRIALGLSQRLKERSKFHAPKRSEPAVFIGSSSEGLDIATCLYNALRRNPVVPQLWSKGVFECSKTTIEDLVRTANETDFAIVVLTADDLTQSRGRTKPAPRDNVIFELGLFMGSLSRERTYIVAQRGIEIKLPTDLLGVTLLTFDLRATKTLAYSLKSVLRELRRLIARLGPL